MKSRVYVETTVISYLAAQPSADIRVAANQQLTTEWWETRKNDFDIYVSEFVVIEAEAGDPDMLHQRLQIIKNFPKLEVTEEVRGLAKDFINKGPIPKKAEVNAYHIAVSAVNGMHYLLTWNCSHIANAAMRPLIENICLQHNYEPPVICTPQELMEE